MTGKCARLVTAGSWLGAAGIKLHTGLGQSQLDRGSDTAEMRLQWNFYVTVPIVRFSRTFQQLFISAV